MRKRSSDIPRDEMITTRDRVSFDVQYGALSCVHGAMGGNGYGGCMDFIRGALRALHRIAEPTLLHTLCCSILLALPGLN